MHLSGGLAGPRLPVKGVFALIFMLSSAKLLSRAH